MGFFNPTKEEELEGYKIELSKFDKELVYKNNLVSLYKAWNNSVLRDFSITETLALHYDLLEIKKLLEKIEVKEPDNLDQIAKLKKLLDDNAITQEEYDAKKKQLLDL